MRGLRFDHHLTLEHHLAKPEPQPGEGLIQVILAGICRTDVEIIQGYLPFRGILGHEFVGRVVAAPGQEAWLGQRVVGEINLPCGHCPFCRDRLTMHCQERQAMGIRGHDGCLADYVTLPLANLHLVPDNVQDEQAVFTEPLAAALAIAQRHHLPPDRTVAVVGDGKLGLLIAQVLALNGGEVHVIGHHPERLAALNHPAILPAPVGEDRRYDLMVECSGSAAGWQTAVQRVRPRGRIILKSSFHGPSFWPGNELMVHEITVSGSRCGPFAPALRLLAAGRIQTQPLVSACYPLEQAIAALHHARQPGTLKILLQP